MTRYCVDSVDQSTWPLRQQCLRAGVGALASLAILLTIPFSAVADDKTVRELLVDWATTSEEHAASARYYAERAREARQEVVRHEEMGTRYAAGNMEGDREQASHCERIANLSRQLATEYDALARNHREEAERLEQEAGDQSR